MYEPYKFGIKIVELSNSTHIMGDLFLDEINQILTIKNPMGIKSNKVSESNSQQTFKIMFHSLSEFSSGKFISVNPDKWDNIIDPTPDIIAEYKKIIKNVSEIKETFDSVDLSKTMSDIMNDLIEKKKPVAGSKKTPPPPKKAKKIIENNRHITERWIDNL